MDGAVETAREQRRRIQELSERIEKLVSEPRHEMVEKNGDAALAAGRYNRRFLKTKFRRAWKKS